jgi:hypothetical protein
MKKLITLFALCLIGIGAYSQKIGNLDVSTSAGATARILVNDDPSGNKLESITKAYFLSDVEDYFTGEDLGDFVRLRTDTSIVLFGAGAGLSGDSVLFAQNMKCFGRFYIEQDTMQIMIARQTYISAGDSLKFNVYWGNAQTNTPVDSLFASPQASGEDQETWTTFNNDKIPPDVDVWPAISGTQIAGYRPYEWSFQLGYITIKQ